MVLNNNFKQFGRIIENGNWSVKANRGTVDFFKNRNNGRLRPYSREIAAGIN
jgi:hypothetical protein